MSPASVNTMSRNSQVLQAIEPPQAPLHIEAPNTFNLREFVPDEDAVNFNSTLWKSIDQSAFVLAQREALEAFNVAKAIRLSEETAAIESKRRSQPPATTEASVSPAMQASSSSVGPSGVVQSQPISIRKSQRSTAAATPISDEAAAISLARSWQVDSLQPALLENKNSVSSLKTHQKLSSVSTSSSSHQQPHHARKASASIAKQPSQNLSLSTSSSPFLDSRIASDSLQVHSRAISQSNAISSSSSSSQPHRIEQRTLSKREPEPSSLSMSPPSSSSSSRNQTSDATNAKRRRTERQPSTSTTSSHNTLVAPSISQSKKSTASARDVRLGQLINPTHETLIPQAAPMEQRSAPRSRPARQASDSDLFTATRNCAKCGNLVDSPRTQPSFAHDPFASPFSGVLHVICTACRTTHCRGCFAVVRCPRDCTGGSSCTVRNCCPDVRAIAIFEALSSFDHIYATEAGFAGKGGKQSQQRQAYIKLLISKADKSMRKFEDAFVRTLRILCSWLQVSKENEGQDKPDLRSLHPSIAGLFAASYLPEVVHGFLSNNNVRDWIAHSETYNAVLETLRCMFDCGLKSVLMRPLRHIEQSCGLQGLVWDQGSITWEVDTGNRLVESPSLCDLVKQLEAHRVPLMALAAKVQFSATVEKVNNLCDGISYLLLQQVVGGL